MERQVVNTFRTKGFNTGMQTFNATLRRHYQDQFINMLLRPASYQFGANVATYWLMTGLGR
ncbi:MAG: hypothetical protein FWB72_07520 [Firmicutes bacterium]|nr:hypothetical protein [Bacillota bacterium]